MITTLHAADPAAAAAPAQPSPLMSFAPLIAIFVIFYFLLIRPQQKKAKEHKSMVDNLKKDDRIVTSSGFYGTVVSVGESTVEVKLADNVRIKMLKSAVAEKLGAPAENGVPAEEKKA